MMESSSSSIEDTILNQPLLTETNSSSFSTLQIPKIPVSSISKDRILSKDNSIESDVSHGTQHFNSSPYSAYNNNYNIPDRTYTSPRTQKRTYVEFLQDYLDRTITYNYWNKYIASAFWSNISTPVNLTITLLSALTAAQANSAGFLDDKTYSRISVVMLLLTTVNTFFRPHEQAQTNMEWLDKWNSIGILFEDAYYDHMELGTTMALGKTVDRYKSIQTEIDALRREDGPGNINFLTDFIHFISMRTCLSGDTWIEYK